MVGWGWYKSVIKIEKAIRRRDVASRGVGDRFYLFYCALCRGGTFVSLTIVVIASFGPSLAGLGSSTKEVVSLTVNLVRSP